MIKHPLTFYSASHSEKLSDLIVVFKGLKPGLNLGVRVQGCPEIGQELRSKTGPNIGTLIVRIGFGYSLL